LAKLEKLAAMNLDPFGGRFPNRQRNVDAAALFKEGDQETKVRIAGRILAFRGHGKAAFADVVDESGKLQAYFRSDRLGEKYEIVRCLDIGDIVGVDGPLFKTKTGELTVLAENLTMLSKSLRPLPEKWHGLRDTELRYRRRYVDLITNPETRETFKVRCNVIRAIRRFMEERSFVEVETPMMHPIAGGANARPFVTHHNTLDMQLFLRIAPELYLKRLLVGGLERVYEINRNFRNEGISTRHNPEFTMLEAYEAYGDYNTAMELTESMFVRAAEAARGLKVTWQGVQLDLTPPWPREPYLELFKKHVAVDPADAGKLAARCREAGIDPAGMPTEYMVNELFEKFVEPKLTGPVFVVDYPVAICPLAKQKRDVPSVAERFELFVVGTEMANAFTELNDPIEQRKRFARQLELKAEGMDQLDEDFLLALEHGMPPAGGLGVGIDRLVMMLAGVDSIREVIFFPLLRKVSLDEDGDGKECRPEAGKTI
ncbi:MAG: lysine--tRNA ligase, partial [Planctomycetota bacterium]|nr:lysine--tRNA ligase [Planctomycetota bacterium]